MLAVGQGVDGVCTAELCGSKSGSFFRTMHGCGFPGNCSCCGRPGVPHTCGLHLYIMYRACTAHQHCFTAEPLLHTDRCSKIIQQVTGQLCLSYALAMAESCHMLAEEQGGTGNTMSGDQATCSTSRNSWERTVLEDCCRERTPSSTDKASLRCPRTKHPTVCCGHRCPPWLQ